MQQKLRPIEVADTLRNGTRAQVDAIRSYAADLIEAMEERIAIKCEDCNKCSSSTSSGTWAHHSES